MNKAASLTSFLLIILTTLLSACATIKVEERHIGRWQGPLNKPNHPLWKLEFQESTFTAYDTNGKIWDGVYTINHETSPYSIDLYGTFSPRTDEKNAYFGSIRFDGDNGMDLTLANAENCATRPFTFDKDSQNVAKFTRITP